MPLTDVLFLNHSNQSISSVLPLFLLDVVLLLFNLPHEVYCGINRDTQD